MDYIAIKYKFKRKMQRIFNSLKNPNSKWLIVYYLSLILLITFNILVFGKNTLYDFQYILWTISIISLIYFIYLIFYFYPKIKSKIVKIMGKNRLTKIFASNYKLRTFVYSFFSVLMNAGYVFFEIYLFYLTKITWFLTLAFYHLALGIYKGSIIYKEYNDKIRNKYELDEIQQKQISAYKYAGIFIFILDMSFIFSITNLLLVKDKLLKYPYLVSIFAIFFVYRICLAVYNLFKAKKYDSYTTQAIRNINLVTALFSLFAFQATLFSVLPLKVDAKLYNLISSLTIWLIIFIISIKMVFKANTKLRKLK